MKFNVPEADSLLSSEALFVLSIISCSFNSSTSTVKEKKSVTNLLLLGSSVKKREGESEKNLIPLFPHS